MPSPRSTLFPYTTLFRSRQRGLTVHPMPVVQPGREDENEGSRHEVGRKRAAHPRSEERFSRNAEPEIYTLSLHDALPISAEGSHRAPNAGRAARTRG